MVCSVPPPFDRLCGMTAGSVLESPPAYALQASPTMLLHALRYFRQQGVLRLLRSLVHQASVTAGQLPLPLVLPPPPPAAASASDSPSATRKRDTRTRGRRTQDLRVRSAKLPHSPDAPARA